MRIFFIVLGLMFSLGSCKEDALNCDESNFEIPQDVLDNLNSEEYSGEEIFGYILDGKVMYVISPRCCDFPTLLF